MSARSWICHSRICAGNALFQQRTIKVRNGKADQGFAKRIATMVQQDHRRICAYVEPRRQIGMYPRLEQRAWTDHARQPDARRELEVVVRGIEAEGRR